MWIILKVSCIPTMLPSVPSYVLFYKKVSLAIGSSFFTPINDDDDYPPRLENEDVELKPLPPAYKPSYPRSQKLDNEMAKIEEEEERDAFPLSPGERRTGIMRTTDVDIAYGMV